jgi:UDP-N-acetylglucosamine--N-acetylmuramyl-(pentapeptide) pyrophosphoryl-undecaprenol N-acetylglucosamine transferase
MSEPVFAVLAGGGTGGHVYPAVSLAQELVARGHAPASIRFVGTKRGPEGRVVPEAGFGIDLLPGRGLQRKLTLANVEVFFATIAAFVRAFALVRRFRPRIVVGFGGYASLPCIVAAWFWRVPRVVHEQDSVIGLANRLGVRLGARVAASLPGVDAPDVVLTGNPIRPEFRDFDRQVQEPPLVAAFGGALGARSINVATLGLYDRWRDRGDVTIHHVTGPRNEIECRERLAELHRSGDTLDYELVGYEPAMPAVYARASIAVCRAGAGTVAELTAAGLPAVLVPLPGAPSDHQARNAATLTAAGAAVVVDDAQCDAVHLDGVLRELLGAPDRLARMSEAARSLARPDAAARLADLVEAHAQPPRAAKQAA